MTRAALVFVLVLALTAIASEPPLSYSAALTTIVDRHPDVGRQKAQIDLVRAQTLSTRLAMLPSVSLFARQDSRHEFGLGANRQGVGASLDVNLFRFGGDFRGMQAAHREIEAEELQLGSTQIRIERLAVDALNDWMLSAQEVEIIARVFKWREDLLEIGKKRFSRGLIPQQEVDRIAIDWENDKATMRDAQTTAIRATALLDQLLGHHSVENQWPWKDVLVKGTFSKADAERELANRPDWRTAEKRWSAAQARASQSWASILPSLDFNVSYGYFRSTISGTVSDRAEYSTSLALTIPLFDRLSAYGAYSAQTETAKQAELELERVRRQARNEWDSARGALSLSVDTALAREKTLGVSRKLYDDNVRRFERGLADANALSLEQQRLLQSEQLAVRGWAAAHATLAQYCFAKGLRTGNCF